MSTPAIIVHQMEGRIRLRAPDMRGERAFFQKLETDLAELEDIYSVSTRPLTGSILIEHDGLSTEALGKWAKDRNLFELTEPPRLKHADASIAQMTQHRLNKIDESLKNSSEGRFDLLSLLMLMAVGLLINEFINGRLAAGSFALVWYALDAAGISTIRKKTGF